MNTTFPSGSGLVLIDTVNEVFSEGGKSYPGFRDELARIGVIDNIKALIAGARENGIQIFFCPMAYSEEEYANWDYRSGIHKIMFDNRLFEEGSWGAEFHPDLAPRSGEVVVAPHKNIDVFATTDLDIQLKRSKIDHVAFAGMIGTMCVESSARSAMERGYHVTMISDATAADSGPAAYDAMISRYVLFAHQVLGTKEFLETLGEG